jgi:uncharacterized LabA/DUF88 family protein
MFGFLKKETKCPEREREKIIRYRYQEKIVIFLDAGNLFHASNHLKIKIDYKKLINLLKRDRWLLRAYFYTGIPSPDLNLPREYREQWRKQQNFLNELQNLGIKVKTMPLKKTPEGFIEKGVDILLATDMLSLAYRNAYDTAILVSGDSDYIPVVEMVQQLGKRVENASFKKTSSFELRKVCDDFILLDKYLDRFTEPLNKPKEPKIELPPKKEGFFAKLKRLIFGIKEDKQQENKKDNSKPEKKKEFVFELKPKGKKNK